MFDVSFGELALIGLVALVVLGPERLPKVARTAGHLAGRLQRYVSDVKADINREMQLEELKKLQNQMAHSAQEMEASVSAEMRAVEASLAENPQAILPPASEAAVEAVPLPPLTGSAPVTVEPAIESPHGQQLELAIEAPKEKA